MPTKEEEVKIAVVGWGGGPADRGGAARTDSLSSTPGTHMERKKTNFPESSSDLHMGTVACVHPQLSLTHTHKCSKNTVETILSFPPPIRSL